MGNPSPRHRTQRILILTVLSLITGLGGITAARKRPAVPAPPSEPPAAPQPAPAPAPKPAPAKPAAAQPAPAPSPSPAPAPAPSPAAQQAPATDQASADPQVGAAQRRAELVRLREQWFHDQRAYPFKHIPGGALQNAIEQRDRMIVQQRRSLGLQLAAPGVISSPGDAIWHPAGPQPTNIPSFPGLGNVGFPTSSGRVTAIAVDPTDATGKTVYIGGAAGGVWKTTDGGSTWTSLTDSQPALAVGSIAIDPNNHLTIYVGTGEENFNQDAFYGAGILKSTDGGMTWTQLGASNFVGPFAADVGGARIGGIVVQPGNPSIVLAAVTFVDGGALGGIYRSANAGATWTQVSAGPVGEELHLEFLGMIIDTCEGRVIELRTWKVDVS